MMRLSLSLPVLVTNEVVLSESEEELFAFDQKYPVSYPKHSFHLAGEEHRSHPVFDLDLDPYQARMTEVSDIPLAT